MQAATCSAMNSIAVLLVSAVLLSHHFQRGEAVGAPLEWQPSVQHIEAGKWQRYAQETQLTPAAGGISPDCHVTDRLSELADMVHQHRAEWEQLRDALSARWKPMLMLKVKAGCTYIRFGALRARDPTTGVRKPSETALVHYVQGTDGFHKFLDDYSAHLLTHIYYAALWGYDLLWYLHNEPMGQYPKGMPFFIEIPAAMRAMYMHGYQNAAVVDFDTFVSPFATVALEIFYAEWPRASVLFQAEPNMCAGVLFYRKTEALPRIFDEWWAMGLSDKFNKHPYDQAALKHMVAKHLADVTGNSTFYADSNLYVPSAVSELDVVHFSKYAQRLQEASDYGFIGLSDQWVDHRLVSLHSCIGLWKGCIPKSAPALFYHHGHWQYQHPGAWMWYLMRNLRAWAATVK